MKAIIRRILAALVLGGVMVPSLQAGNEALLYPLARMFGSPSEAELARCRQTFQQLQTRLGDSRVVLAPVYVVDGGRGEWRPELAQAILRAASRRTAARFEMAAAPPAVARAVLGHNQLRYLWERAAVYSAWVQAAPPAGDYVWIAEVWGLDGKVGAIHVYVLDTRGQIAYSRLYNSRQFGPDLPLDGEAAIELLVEGFFEDVTKEPKKIFPPFGVG